MFNTMVIGRIAARIHPRPRLCLDASVLVRLVVSEDETPALRARLRGHTIVSSDLVLAEVPRALMHKRGGSSARLTAQAGALLETVGLVPCDSTVLRAAGALREPHLRTLDAIHVVSAMCIGPDLDAFVSFDGRQLDVAQRAGMPVASPER